jgi:hypothetical protein
MTAMLITTTPIRNSSNAHTHTALVDRRRMPIAQKMMPMRQTAGQTAIPT